VQPGPGSGGTVAGSVVAPGVAGGVTAYGTVKRALVRVCVSPALCVHARAVYLRTLQPLLVGAGGPCWWANPPLAHSVCAQSACCAHWTSVSEQW
jgi:hypothetical protein